MNPLLRLSSPLLALLIVVMPPQMARAERDAFFTGTGRDGALTVGAVNTVVNVYTGLAASVSAGATTVTVSSGTGLAAGDLVMLHQSTGILPEPASGTAGPLDLTSNTVGRWELARLSGVSGTTLTLANALVNSYVTPGAQVIRVPEYTDVTINASRSITASPWNGISGGVAAMLVSGTLTNASSVTVAAKGFRGGFPVNDLSDFGGSSGLDEPAPQGAQKGEGIARTRYGSTKTGRGRVANGAGGGVAYLSGGGGGSNGGAGGQGGNSDGTDGLRAVGGQGGVALTYGLLDHLVWGGGGGAGHEANGTSATAGSGGGLLFIRAGFIAGTGTYQASGSAGGSSSGQDAAGGGGGGGAIYLRVAGSAASGLITALGAGGGSALSATRVGPGGGGGGGRILFQKGSGAAAPAGTATNGSASGSQGDVSSPLGTSQGATAGTAGSVTTLSGAFTQRSVPVLTAPGAGAAVSTTPTFSGTAPMASTVHVVVDGTELSTTTADGSGNFSLTAGTALSSGAHSVVLYAADATQGTFSTDSAASAFTVTSSNANLLSLVPSTGALSPVFDSATTAYSFTLPRSSASITVTPTVADSSATLQVRVNSGSYASVTSGSASGSLALSLGSNTIDVLVTAPDGTTTKTYTITVTRWTYIEGWRNQYYSVIANSGNAADTAIPLNDGLANLLKFATGMNPTVLGVSPATLVKNGTTLEFSYPRSVQATAECTFVVEWTDTLVAGSWSTTGVTEAILSDNGTLQQVKASLPAGSNERRFVRLRVTNP